MTSSQPNFKKCFGEMRKVTRQSLTTAAKGAGVKIDASKASFSGSVAGVMAANAPCQLGPDFSWERLVDGHELMFIYLAAPAGSKLRDNGEKFKPGYYIVRFSGTPKDCHASIRNIHGEMVHECPAEVEVDQNGTARALKGAPPIAVPDGSTGYKGGGRGNLIGCVTLDLDGSAKGVRYHIKIVLCF
jgi:hypothetical protein